MRNYHDIIKIDEGNLWKEWVEAPSRYMEVIEAQVDASEQEDQLKVKLEVLQSSLGNEIRKNPEKFGVSKVTEASVRDAVAALKEVQAVQEELREARKQRQLIAGLVTAMEHRRRALENLVELEGRNYRAEPRPITPVSKERVDSETTKHAHDQIAQRMSSRRRVR